MLDFLGDAVVSLAELYFKKRGKKNNDGCFWYGLVLFFIFIGVFIWLHLD